MKLKISRNACINILYVVFIISGIIKAVFLYIGIPKIMDVTAISAALILLDMGYVTFVKRAKLGISTKQLNYLIIVVLFQCIAFASLFYTASTGFGYYKSALLILNIIAFTYPLFRNEISLHSFFKILYKIIIPFSIFIIFLNFVRWTPYKTLLNIPRADAIRGHYLTIGMFLGLIAMYHIIFRAQLKSGLYLKILLPILLLIMSSARGPLIFFLATIVMLLVLKIKWLRFKIRMQNMLYAAVLGIIILATPIRSTFFDLFSRTLDRFKTMFYSEQGGDSISGRIEFLSFSFDSITEGPLRLLFGYGIGSFMILYTGEDGRGYPHNILIESLFELGLPGLIALVLFLGLIFFYKTKKTAPKFLLVFLLLCYSKSGGLEDIRIIYAMYALYLSAMFSNKTLEI